MLRDNSLNYKQIRDLSIDWVSDISVCVKTAWEDCRVAFSPKKSEDLRQDKKKYQDIKLSQGGLGFTPTHLYEHTHTQTNTHKDTNN